MADVIAQNKRRALILVTGFFLVIAVVGGLLLALVGLGLTGVLIALVIAAAITFAAYGSSDGVALKASNAVAADPVAHPRLHNLVEGLCVASGLPKPAIHVIEDSAPNALAVGRSPKHAAVVVTSGLLDVMDRMELEAVLAHELSHVKNHDIVVSTLAVTMLGLAAPFLVPSVVGEQRESHADRSAVEMTRFPPALVTALEKLRADTTEVAAGSRAIAHLWIEAPAATHPPIEERIDTLREL